MKGATAKKAEIHEYLEADAEGYHLAKPILFTNPAFAEPGDFKLWNI
jgi:hypothetical protein